MIIAPAGHGKTHTIVNCLESYKFSGKKILVLTHTNAGIASIREKILLRSIESCKFEIMTICSFAIDIVHHYVSSMLLPDDSDMNEKYKEAERLSIRLLKVEPIKIVLKAKYEHVIVDEYQDCDSIQHKLIEGIGQIISTHIDVYKRQVYKFNETLKDLINGDDTMPSAYQKATRGERSKLLAFVETLREIQERDIDNKVKQSLKLVAFALDRCV